MSINFEDTIHITPIPDGVTEQEFESEVGRLDGRINVIEASSDVTDVVGTYSDLENYDTSTLTDNDIIKVLVDSTRDDATSYYRWSTTSETFSFVGSLGPFASEDYIDNNFAKQDLSNLSTQGGARLHALKGYEDAGKLLTDAEGLADVTNYAHSTFDRSKFTVTGSPTITDNGMISNTTVNNYVSCSEITGSLIGSNDFEFEISFEATSDSFSYSSMIVGGDNSINQGIFQIYSATNGSLSVATYTDNEGTANRVELNNLTLGGISTNAIYKVILKRVGSSLSATTYKNNVLQQTRTTTINTNLYANSNALKIGKGSLSDKKVDLKSVNLKVSNIPVFSGNKTGIDTIKPDNYTVVGSPTISADGVMTVDATGNGVTCSILDKLRSANTWLIEGKFKTSNDISSNQTIIGHENLMRIRIASGKLNVLFATTNTTWAASSSLLNYAVYANTTYYYKFLFNGSSYIMELSNDGVTYSKILDYTDNTKLISGDNTLSIGSNYHNSTSQATVPLIGSTDLNLFKIYVDGNLVYQPCLKIPYTLSKTGAKIVDSQYRNRVSDMYEQYGYAPYYTLSDTDFTLPMGELYGMIERKMPNTTAIVTISQTDYNNLTVVDPNTLYIITGA